MYECCSAFSLGLFAWLYRRRGQGSDSLVLTVLTSGYQLSEHKFMFEGVLLFRKWVIILVSLYVVDPFLSMLLTLGGSVLVLMLVIRWKPFAMEGGQFEARLAQIILIVLHVRLIVGCACLHCRYGSV